MAQVQLVIDLVEPGVGRRRAERTTTLPGVPSVGDAVWVAKMLALTVSAVAWQAREEGVLIFLKRGTANPESIIDHDGELQLAPRWIDALLDEGWTIGDYGD